MDKCETWDLFTKGRIAWNKWARELLQDKQRMEQSSDWKNMAVDWQERAVADFTGQTFDDDADFRGFLFPGRVLFKNATFRKEMIFGPRKPVEPLDTSNTVVSSGRVTFDGSRFCAQAFFNRSIFESGATFLNTCFKDVAVFQETRFDGPCAFNSAKFNRTANFGQAGFLDDALFWTTEFSNEVNFGRATFMQSTEFVLAAFHGNVKFDNAAFKRSATFRNAKFFHTSTFKGISVEGLFALQRATFRCLPDFTDSYFRTAPVFYRAALGPNHFKTSNSFSKCESIPEQWSALKRLAIQGHDHEKELEFLKGEIISRRNTFDTRFHARYWIGQLYGLLSDFGQSISRPLMFLVIGFLLFSVLYFVQRENGNIGKCDIEHGAVVASINLSLYNSLPLLSGVSTRVLDHSHACLYGLGHSVEEKNRFDKAEEGSYVPLSVQFTATFQRLLSTTLIFLFGLAVRNRFKIK